MLNLVTKGEFARLVNLSPGRVSQMIAEGKIADCLVGEGRNQKIDAAKAVEKLKIRRDAGQALGNGAKTVLVAPTAPLAETPAPVAAAEPGPRAVSDDLDVKLKLAKLEDAEARNRKNREEELERRGLYVRAAHAAAEGGKLASTILQMFEAGLTEAAAEIAAHFKLPARDVQHMMRQRFREVRTQVSKRLADQAAALPQLIEDAEAD